MHLLASHLLCCIWLSVSLSINKLYNAFFKVFVNGDLSQEERGSGLLSLDWGGKVGIGRHKHQFGNRLLRGMIDEFYIFPCELPRLEILVLLRHCRVYFSKSLVDLFFYQAVDFDLNNRHDRARQGP